MSVRKTLSRDRSTTNLKKVKVTDKLILVSFTLFYHINSCNSYTYDNDDDDKDDMDDKADNNNQALLNNAF